MGDRHARVAVCFDPAIRWGRGQIHGVPTAAVADLYWAGESADTVSADYDLTRHELLVALWFEGSHGEPRFRRRWKRWAEEVAYPRLAGWKKPLDIDSLPLPPDRNGDAG